MNPEVRFTLVYASGSVAIYEAENGRGHIVTKTINIEDGSIIYRVTIMGETVLEWHSEV